MATSFIASTIDRNFRRVTSTRVGVPPGFRPKTRKSFNATVVEERDDPRRVFTVRSTNPANPLPQASRDYRAWAPKNLNDFREVSYKENQTYAGHKGAVVFEYEANLGLQHRVHRPGRPVGRLQGAGPPVRGGVRAARLTGGARVVATRPGSR